MARVNEAERRLKARAALAAAARQPVERFDPATGAVVIAFNDLADYLRQHGLAVVHSEWKPGQSRPMYYTARVNAPEKNT